MPREPGHCPKGHPCLVNGLIIRCPVCGWIDESTFADIMASSDFVPAEAEPTVEDVLANPLVPQGRTGGEPR